MALLVSLADHPRAIAGTNGGGVSRFDIDNAPAPLFDDPKYHGAADPTVIYVEATRTWYMERRSQRGMQKARARPCLNRRR
jgi:hypothetical protein